MYWYLRDHMNNEDSLFMGDRHTTKRLGDLFQKKKMLNRATLGRM